MDMSRRQVLASIGMAPLGGCAGSFASDSGIRLGGIRVANTADRVAYTADEPHTVDLVLERNGSRVHNEMVEVDPGESVWIDQTWSSEPAEYVLYYTVSGSDEVSIADFTGTVAPADTKECVVADLWTVMNKSGADVLLKGADQYEEATCNS